jgi:1,4-dihydroxy-2-naphthoyl-CoA hydrolase
MSNVLNVTGHIEFVITDQSPDQVIATMPVQAGVLNPFGVAHAGAILWFADVCATVLAAGKMELVAGAAGFPLAINLNAAFLGNQKGGTFKAISEFVKRGGQLSVVRTTVSGDGGRLIAEVTTSHIASR